MPDDRDEPRKAPSAGDETRAGDATQEFDPFADDDEDDAKPAATAGPGATAPLPAPDQTAPMPSADATAALPAASDETRPIPAASDETRPIPAASDETRPIPAASDETRPIPAGDADRTAPLAGAGAEVWSGRAGVPPPRSTTIRGPVPPDWEPPPDGDERRWWMPIVVGFVALALLGTLAVGIWLIMRANDDATPGESTPSATVAPTTAAPTTAAAPTTSAPAPTTAAPASVEVPALVGLTEAEAQERLDELGLTHRLEYRESGEPPGTVIESDPAQGMSVPEGTQIVLVIAKAPPTTAPPTLPTALPTLPTTTP